jgi:hypothetical protein
MADVSDKGLKYNELFVAPTAEGRKVEAAYRAKKAKKSMLSFFSFKDGLGWLFRKEKPIEYMDYVGSVNSRIPMKKKILVTFLPT